MIVVGYFLLEKIIEICMDTNFLNNIQKKPDLYDQVFFFNFYNAFLS